MISRSSEDAKARNASPFRLAERCVHDDIPPWASSHLGWLNCPRAGRKRKRQPRPGGPSCENIPITDKQPVLKIRRPRNLSRVLEKTVHLGESSLRDGTQLDMQLLGC